MENVDVPLLGKVLDHEAEVVVAVEKNRRGRGENVLAEQLKKVVKMAAPMVVVSVAQYLVQVVSLIMSGHLGELSLSAVAVATSFTNVTGFALLFGLAGALETLCGQAYGAEQHQKCGTYTYSAILTLLPLCIPISILWFFLETLLISIGQDPDISQSACRYAITLIPALFGDAVLQSLNRYFQSQGLTMPMLLSSVAALCVHVPMCWVLSYNCGLGNVGAAVSIGLAYWFNAGLLVCYMRWSSSCEKSRGVCWGDVLSCVGEFWRFAVPSAVMVCLEWWTFELLVLLAGLLPNAALETSVLSICLTTTSLHYYVQYGIGAAASTGVSNELGAGNPEKAKAVIKSAAAISTTEAIVVSTTLFCCRSFFGYVFSNEGEVVEYVSEVAPLLCMSVIVDSSLAVLSGVARGSGWQHIGAYVNLGAYYGIGMPVAVVMCFVVGLDGEGLWIGILTASTLQAGLFGFVTVFTDWELQASKARERIFDGCPTILPA
ncbi:Protein DETOXIFICATION 7 [Linum grandiflorum]